MKHEISLRNLPNQARLDGLIRRLAARVDEQVVDYWQRTGLLHAVMHKYPTRACYRISLVLSVPHHTLVAHEEGREAETVVRSAFLEIERQLRKEKSRLRREDLWKRRARRTRIRQEWKLAPVAREAGERGLLADLVLANLQWLYTLARREIAHHVATGDLARHDLEVAEVVDAVVLRACAEFDRRPPGLSVGAWLERLTVEHLAAEVERLGRRLGLEDVVPDELAPNPDRVAEGHELARWLTDAVAALPPPWRTAFELHYVDELPVEDVARMISQTESEVRSGLDSTRALLRQRIVASGLAQSA